MTAFTIGAGRDILSSYGRSLPTWDAYQAVTGRVVAAVNDLLPRGADSRPSRQLGASWRQNVLPPLGEVEPVLAEMAGTLNGILGDTQHTSQWQAQQQTAALASANKRLQQIGGEVETAAEALMVKAQRLALPSRPTPATAGQETRLAGLKSDLQLLTSRISPRDATAGREFAARIGDRLTAALADQDELAAWLLCSDWPCAILAPSLGFTTMDLDAVRAELDAMLVDRLAAGSADAAEAIRISRALSEPSGGLPALIVATGGFLSQVASDLSGYVQGQARGF